MLDDYKETWQRSQILIPFIAALIIFFSFSGYIAWGLALAIFFLGYLRGYAARKHKTTKPDFIGENLILQLIPFVVALTIFYAFNDFKSWIICADVFILGVLKGYEARRMKEEGKTLTGAFKPKTEETKEEPVIEEQKPKKKKKKRSSGNDEDRMVPSEPSGVTPVDDPSLIVTPDKIEVVEEQK